MDNMEIVKKINDYIMEGYEIRSEMYIRMYLNKDDYDDFAEEFCNLWIKAWDLFRELDIGIREFDEKYHNDLEYWVDSFIEVLKSQIKKDKKYFKKAVSISA